LYSLIKLLIIIERTVDLCLITKKTKKKYTCIRAGYNIQTCTQAGPAHAAGHGDGMDRWQHSSHLHYTVVRRRSPVTLTQAPWVRQQRQTTSTDCHAVMSIAQATE